MFWKAWARLRTMRLPAELSRIKCAPNFSFLIAEKACMKFTVKGVRQESTIGKKSTHGCAGEAGAPIRGEELQRHPFWRPQALKPATAGCCTLSQLSTLLLRLCSNPGCCAFGPYHVCVLCRGNVSLCHYQHCARAKL